MEHCRGLGLLIQDDVLFYTTLLLSLCFFEFQMVSSLDVLS